MATIYDIAKAAGVTATTVSNVLSGKGSVGAATKARVMKFVQQLDYQPNLIARSLIKGRTGVIGLVLPVIENPFYAEITAVVERLAYAANLRVLPTMLSDNDSIGKRLLKDLIMRRVDGLLVMCSGITASVHETLLETSVPAVYCLDEGSTEELSLVVSYDFAQGGRLAAEHLLNLGHRHFGIVTHTDESGLPSHSLRVQGFVHTVQRFDSAVDASSIVPGHGLLAESKAIACHLLTRERRPTAIFATNDLTAIGVLSAAWELGLRVPGDLSVVGLDDISLGQYTTPPLTSVAIDKVSLMARAIDVLLKVLEGETITAPPLQPASLKVRASTGPCPY
ncbi:MAG TPA: LacI family DNA-binding transcriptional regulator [Ktedonobacteraceae bacterium]|jgi:DNA-binding LacI/PurR family transcriptional regulator|nr:LacI family DNA-binding transcriptional regulator [Ktedonobacteraceae bacterium]